LKRYLLRKENFGWIFFDRTKSTIGFAGNTPLEFIDDDILGDSDIVSSPQDNYSTLSAPTRVFLVLTKRCNLKCVYCSNYSSASNPEEIPLEKAKEILRELRRMGVFEISFNGGEAVLYPHFKEITKEALDLGFVSLINTNGVYSDAHRKMLLESGIKKIKVSLDGPEEINDSLRGKGTFKEAMKTINYLHKNGVDVKIICTLSKTNLPYMLDLVKIAESIPCELKIAPMHNVGRAKGIWDSPLKIADIIKTRNEILAYCESKKISNLVNINTTLFADVSGEQHILTGKHIKCLVNRAHVSIDANGAIYLSGCQTSFEKSKSLGNIYNNNFTKIWQDIKEYNEEQRNSSVECKNCLIEKKLLDYFEVIGAYKGELWETPKTEDMFKY
jgi:radical SAM protein with 4Fe4S-binding SPASM domain